MARLQVGSQVRLKSTRGLTVDVGGKKQRIEGCSDGVIIGSIDAKKWKVKFLNGTPDGIVAALLSGQLVNRETRPASSNNTATTSNKSTPAAAGSNTTSDPPTTLSPTRAAKKKKGKKASTYPTAEELIEAFSSESLTVCPDGTIKESAYNPTDNGGNDDDDDNSSKNGDKLESGDEEVEDDGSGDNEDELETEDDPLDMLAMGFEMDLNPDELSKHQQKAAKYQTERNALVENGYSVKCKNGREWKAVAESIPDNNRGQEEYEFVGLQGYDWERLTAEGKDENAVLELISLLWPDDWHEQVDNINHMIRNDQKAGKKVEFVSDKEFWTFIALMIIAGSLRKGGIHLWAQNKTPPPYRFATPE